MFIITTHMTLLSFGLAPTEIGPSDTVSPSRPEMNKSWNVLVHWADQTTPEGRRRQILSPERARNLISDDQIKSVSTMTDSEQTPHPLLVAAQVLRWLDGCIFHRCWLFINTQVLSATAAITFSAVVRIRALSPFWLGEWDNLSVKERLAGQECRLKLSTDPSLRRNGAANVCVELVFMLHWMKVWA